MKEKTKRSNLLKFHRPRLRLNEAPIPVLKPESKQCLQNLLHYRPPASSLQYPKSRSAAVLVALFVGRMGDLYVLLSRRASSLRTYAGDTSLPGGKWEPLDRTFEWTARREAFEEIGLPQDSKKVPLLCVLEPFLAGHQLIVTPVVVLILDTTLRPILNASEVASLFSHPLAALLHTEPPSPGEQATLELPYHTYRDVVGPLGRERQHRFLTGREAGGTKPIFGLTAAILLRAAAVGYARAPDFTLCAPGEPAREQRLAHALRYEPVLREAARREGIDPDADQDAAALGARSRVGRARGGVRSRL